MLLSHDEILELVERGVIQNAKPEAVNASSIDVHLGNTIMIEDFYWGAKIIDYRDREKPFMRKIDIDENGFVFGTKSVYFGADGRNVQFTARHQCRI